MESTCQVFLAPRAQPGQPTVLITRAPNGPLLAAVSCDCPPGRACATHTVDELLQRSYAHHKAVAPRVPCTFEMRPRDGQADRPLGPGVTLFQEIPATSPYGPTTIQSVAAADPTNVRPGKQFRLSYMPPHVFKPGPAWMGSAVCMKGIDIVARTTQQHKPQQGKGD